MMVLFGFFSLVLILVYWINRAVVLFDQLIANGQSAFVFLEFTALSLPNVIALVLPMAGFAAAVYGTNRLAADSELVVVQATGYSPYRLARPVLIFGLIVGILVSILTHFLVPISLAQLRERTIEVSDNVTARLLREGTFLHPSPGITFYIGHITPEGELLDVFLSDARADGSRTNYSARSALLLHQVEGPRLIMFDGVSQTLSEETQRLSTTSFTDFSIDVATFMDKPVSKTRRANELSTPELLWPSDAIIEETRSRRAVLLQEGHERFAQASLAVIATVIGFSALLIGGYSRFGLWRQIGLAVFLLIVLKSLDNAMADLARSDAAFWPVSYVSTLAGVFVCYALLWLSARPALFSARRRAGAI